MNTCDRCCAAAQVRVSLPSRSELLFCQHHYNEVEVTLVLAGACASEVLPDWVSSWHTVSS